MKCLIVVFLALFASVTVHAQLKNTKWKGTIHADNDIDVVFNYSKDTVDVSNSTDGSNIETMSYSIKDSILTLQKISGQSDCNSNSAGKYIIEIKDDLLYIKLLSDDCLDRSSALKDTKWMKVK